MCTALLITPQKHHSCPPSRCKPPKVHILHIVHIIKVTKASTCRHKKEVLRIGPFYSSIHEVFVDAMNDSRAFKRTCYRSVASTELPTMLLLLRNHHINRFPAGRCHNTSAFFFNHPTVCITSTFPARYFKTLIVHTIANLVHDSTIHAVTRHILQTN